MRRLLGSSDLAAIVPLTGHRSWSVNELLQALPQYADRLESIESPRAGLGWLGRSGPLPVVAGSLLLLGEVIPQLDPTN